MKRPSKAGTRNQNLSQSDKIMLLAVFLFALSAGYTFALGNDASSNFDYAVAMSMVVFFFIFFATVVWKVSLFHEKLKKDYDDFYGG